MNEKNIRRHLGEMDLVLRGASQLLTVPGETPDSESPETRLGIIEDGALCVKDSTVVWVGKSDLLPKSPPGEFDGSWIDADGCAVIPGLIDCHTHLIHAGTREREFELRISGRSYAEIAAAGGGILSTVSATRLANADELMLLGQRRLDQSLIQGITTVEIKSGYGLETDTELKILTVAATLNRSHPVDVVSTFLGAHELPAEYRIPGGKDRYLELVINEMLPEVGRQGLAEFCDVFCENGVYDVEESRRVLQAGLGYGLRPKIHADQLSPLGGTELAADLGAVSADHLEYASERGLEKAAAAGVVAVLLPGCEFFLGSGRYADARRMLEKGLRVALATDFNPGSCMSQSLPLMMTMACTQMRLTPAESLLAATRYAAAALCREGRVGSLMPGSIADLVVLDAPDYRTLVYHFGTNHAATVVKRGAIVTRKGSRLT